MGVSSTGSDMESTRCRSGYITGLNLVEVPKWQVTYSLAYGRDCCCAFAALALFIFPIH